MANRTELKRILLDFIMRVRETERVRETVVAEGIFLEKERKKNEVTHKDTKSKDFQFMPR